MHFYHLLQPSLVVLIQFNKQVGLVATTQSVLRVPEGMSNATSIEKFFAQVVPSIIQGNQTKIIFCNSLRVTPKVDGVALWVHLQMHKGAASIQT